MLIILILIHNSIYRVTKRCEQHCSASLPQFSVMSLQLISTEPLRWHGVICCFFFFLKKMWPKINILRSHFTIFRPQTKNLMATNYYLMATHCVT